MTATLDRPADPKLVPISGEFLDDEFVAAVQRRARLRAAGETLDEFVASAESAHADAVEAVGRGGHGAVEELVAACARLASVYAARAALPPPQLSLEAVSGPMNRAGTRLLAAAKSFELEPLGSRLDVEAWRQWGRMHHSLPDPPLVLDAERHLENLADDFTTVTKGWRDTQTAWFGVAKQGMAAADPCDLLAAASQLIDQAVTFAEDADALNDRILTANYERRQAGRTWAPPR